MLPKKQRLIIKEVNYILHKRQTISCQDLLFFVVPQYLNKQHSQRWIQLSTKVHKRSTRRNKVKRLFYDHIQLTLQWKNLPQKNIKTIALIHKTKIDERNTLLENKQRTIVDEKLTLNIQTLIYKLLQGL